MTTRWEKLVALAAEIERARTSGVIIDPERARRLARAVLRIDQERRGSEPPTVDALRAHG